MATTSGVWGQMVRGNDSTTTQFTYCVSQWTLESMATLKEDTSSCTNGHEHRSVVKKGHKLTATVYVGDDTPGAGIPDQTGPGKAGMIPGDEILLWLRTGDLLWYNQWLFIIDSVSLKGCDADGLVTYGIVAYTQEPKPALDSSNLDGA
jgi:hypothetical protein